MIHKLTWGEFVIHKQGGHFGAISRMQLLVNRAFSIIWEFGENLPSVSEASGGAKDRAGQAGLLGGSYFVDCPFFRFFRPLFPEEAYYIDCALFTFLRPLFTF
jgi:hypothetical protein